MYPNLCYYKKRGTKYAMSYPINHLSSGHVRGTENIPLNLRVRVGGPSGQKNYVGHVDFSEISKKY